MRKNGGAMGIFGPNINKMVKENDIDGLKDLFRENPNPKIKKKVAYGICQTKNVEAMISMMDTPDYLPIFVESLAKLGKTGFSALEKALDDENPLRAGGAATALGLSGVWEALSPLTRVVEAEHHPAQIPALIALGEMGGHEARDAIVHASVYNQDPKVARTAKEVLHKKFANLNYYGSIKVS
jgi:hypothetical protein